MHTCSPIHIPFISPNTIFYNSVGIGRLRTGKAGNVTPLEFRFTMNKLGIFLPKELSDLVFADFDSDRSGSISFDEFSAW